MARPKGTRDLFTRLLDKTIVGDVNDCWIWQGGRNNIGYGMIRDEKKMRTTHRVSYEKHHDIKIPSGMCVCHSCDNPLCVNPSHLWLGTKKQNTDDMIAKGRQVFWGGGMRGRKQPKKSCPHCSKEVAHNLYDRWHGDNCKLKAQV